MHTYFELLQWLSSEESVCNAGDLGLIPELGRSPGHGNPLQYSRLVNLMIKIALNLQIAWGSVVILTILILSVYGQSISFHLFVLSSISSTQFLSTNKSFTSLGRFMPKHFIVFFSVKTFTSDHFYHPVKHTKQKGNFFR